MFEDKKSINGGVRAFSGLSAKMGCEAIRCD